MDVVGSDGRDFAAWAGRFKGAEKKSSKYYLNSSRVCLEYLVLVERDARREICTTSSIGRAADS